MRRFSLRRPLLALALALGFASQATWTLAGVTGNMAGTVRDNTGAPVAGATVQVVSPSQTASTTTDANGHFILLSLAPDTYVVSLSKTGYSPTSFPGEVVFADQTQQATYTLAKTLKTIANVTASGAGNLVKSGVGGDIYSVNSTQAAAAAALGGGGNLNNAFSAMSSVPGLQVDLGGAGWTFNAAYVRGQNYQWTGYEYDGIPINRAFDNYNASTESSLGLQELQVYTGGGPASVSSSGTSGFVNQVIKTGTFPGYATATLGVGAPTFYHQAQVEVGGATPDRNFSWYAGFSGYNQDYRFLTQDNAASLNQPNEYFSGPALASSLGYTASPTFTGQGVKQSCPVGAPPANAPPQGCWTYYSGNAAAPSTITDRENVINLHFGIPKKNGLRDDIQALWSSSALNNYTYSSLANLGTTASQFFYAWRLTGPQAPVCGQMTVVAWAGVSTNACTLNPGVFGLGGACSPTYSGCYLPYADQVAYNLPFGTPVAKSPSNFSAPTLYKAPSTPNHAFAGPIDPNDNSLQTYENDTGITKLQYTYALSNSAYLRAYGYTFYSDWLQNGPIFGATAQGTPTIPSAQYDLMTHSTGGALDFNDQINDQNLLTANYNYTQASVIRFNNSSAIAGGGTTPIGYMDDGNCLDAHNGKAVPCISSTYFNVALGKSVSPTTFYSGAAGTCDTGKGTIPCGWRSNAIVGPTGYGGGENASWDTLWNGEVTGAYNTVKPRFQNASIGDQFRPNDKVMINASLRYDNFTYVMPNVAGAADTFYADQVANYTCVQPASNQVFTTPLPPGQPPPANPQYVLGDCNEAVNALTGISNAKGWVHPNGKTQDGVGAPNFTATSPGSYSIDYWQPRVSATYTESADTVWRLSAGRYAAPPISSSVQYLSASGDNRSIWANAMNLGFYSPFHPIPGISSDQYDLSYERHITGTDMSLKLTPYFTWVNNWQQQTFIG
ncbi:MAG TPA: TonB-dependent receptor, partial [Candidatus Baltobacteraceae bacterium]|nr:TonB-dependent receptor [Candidatus Baltobacteraceae bacterium]